MFDRFELTYRLSQIRQYQKHLIKNTNMPPDPIEPSDNESESDTDQQGQAEQCEESERDILQDEIEVLAATDEHPESLSDIDTPLAVLGRRSRTAARATTTQNRTTVLPGPDLSFQPLPVEQNRVNSTGHANPHTMRNLKTPLEVFSRFFPHSILQTIAQNTKIYAERKGAGSGRAWSDTNACEISHFFGLIVYMGIYPSPRITDYWRTGGVGPIHSIRNCMSLIRFEQIKRYIHICDPTGDNGNSYFFKKMEPLWSTVLEACKSSWIPGFHVSPDEMMVINFGRSSETVKMRGKPIKSGFKIWALGDHGYTYAFIPHSNAHTWYHLESYKRDFNYHAAVVAYLANELPRNLTESFHCAQFCMYMDNLFSTPPLFRYLRERGVGAVGTVRSNAKNLPKNVALRGKQNLCLNWNELGSVTYEDGKVLALIWIDNAPVQMLTSVHKVSHGHTIDKLRRKPRLTSTNGARVREVFGNSPRKLLPIPTVVNDYNKHMGGVDIADQLRSSFTSHLPSRRVWLPLLFWLLETAATNSYLLLASTDPSYENKHRDFCEALAISLTEVGTEPPVQTRSQRLSMESENGDSSSRGKAKAGGYISKHSKNPKFLVRKDQLHFPVRVKYGDRAECFHCRRGDNGEKKRRRTTFKCSSCSLFLCLENERNCFKDFHEEMLLKK